jgi:hypothetical protein
MRYQTRAELDVPGETGRQTRVFFVWLLCLAVAIGIGISQRPRVPLGDRGTPRETEEVARSQRARLWTGLLFGLLLPAGLTFGLTHRRRRGGPHARGIVIDITADGELRLWGRGYGQRVRLTGATISERLIDVYAGRQGAWRQRRLTVNPAQGRPLELATMASESDERFDLSIYGGEGNCVEIARRDYLALRELVRELAGTSQGKPGQGKPD